MLTSAMIIFAVAMVVSFVFTPLVRRFAVKINAVDVPKDNRRMHKVPIPRIGGIAIFIGFMSAMLIFGKADTDMMWILVGGLVIAALGIVDDLYALPALVKLVGQIIAAIIPVMNNIVIQNLTNPFASDGNLSLGIWGAPLTVLWIVAITNAVNFIDGLDGLACGVSAIASISMFVTAYLIPESPLTVTLAMAALAGACLGFLPFNFNPARIFMGDTGSMFIGYIFAVCSVQGLFKMHAVISFAVPFVVLAIPLADMIFAVIRRVARGKSPFSADRGHIHHKLIDMGLDQKQSVLILYCLNIVFGVISVLMATTGESKFVILAISVALAFFVAVSVMIYGKNLLQQNENRTEDKKEE